MRTFFGSKSAIASLTIGSSRSVEGSFSLAASVSPASGAMHELFISNSSTEEVMSVFECSTLTDSVGVVG